MSEDTTNLINVEDDAPVVTPEAPVPEPVAPAEHEEVDLSAIDLKDEQRVKGIIGELNRMREQNRTLKPQAERAAQLEAELNQAKPYLDFVRNNPQLLQPRQEPAQAPPEADPDAVEAARLMDFYTTDGKPDVERGAKWLALQDRRSGRVAQQQIAPTVQQTLTDRAQSNYVMLRNFKLSDGTPLKPEIVDGIWQAAAREPNGLQTLANPESVRALALLALGAQSLSTRPAPAAPAKDPVVTEAGGGRASTPVQRLSSIEERVLAQRGMAPGKYQELTKDFKPGVPNVLED